MRETSRADLLLCKDISVSFDERKVWNDFAFRGCTLDSLEVIRGHFGLSMHGHRDIEGEKQAEHPADVNPRVRSSIVTLQNFKMH